MKKVLLKDLFEEKMKPKNYHKTKQGYYVIVKWGEYYFSSKNKEEVDKVIEKLEECNWDKTQLPRIKKELKIVKNYSTNTTGFYRVIIRKNSHFERGYLYSYEFTDEYNIKTRYTSKSLRGLRKKVLKKKMLWKPLTEDAKFIEKVISDEIGTR